MQQNDIHQWRLQHLGLCRQVFSGRQFYPIYLFLEAAWSCGLGGFIDDSAGLESTIPLLDVLIFHPCCPLHSVMQSSDRILSGYTFLNMTVGWLEGWQGFPTMRKTCSHEARYSSNRVFRRCAMHAVTKQGIAPAGPLSAA